MIKSETANRNYDWYTDWNLFQHCERTRKNHFHDDRVWHNLCVVQSTFRNWSIFQKQITQKKNRDQTNKPDKRSWGAKSHIIQHSCMKVKIALISCAGIQIQSTPSSLEPLILAHFTCFAQSGTTTSPIALRSSHRPFISSFIHSCGDRRSWLYTVYQQHSHAMP